MPKLTLSALVTVCLLAIGPGASAEDLPKYASSYLNDWADLLSAEQEQELTDEIAQLRGATGIELVVVTLDTKASFGWSDLEPFATAIFNDWGVGDAQRNDGIMVLVLPEDREMRIELGRGYGPGFNRVAQSLVDTDFLPQFRVDRYDTGLLDGTRAVIGEIAWPFFKGTPPATPSFWDRYGHFAIFGAFVAAIFGLSQKQRLADFMTRFRRCPTCGQRKLHVTRETTIPATDDNDGHAVKRTHCTNCDWGSAERYRVRHTSGRSGGSFGGGSSSGGGASGRW